MKKWVILNKQKTINKKQRTKEEIIKILLENRGIVKKKDIDEFLHPSLDKSDLKNVSLDRREADKAVKRIKRAIKNKESIVVYTDYDVDGLCSGAIVWETLFDLGAKVMPYVPHRVTEGYGLSKKGIETVKKLHQTSLIITVDHGVSAGSKIEYAQSLGIETIIIDHHLLTSRILPVCALIHTTELCATGAAWIFCNYLKQKTDKQNLELVALATIADLVPLVKHNRTLVIYGLQQLNKTTRIGLNALFEVSGIKKGNIGVYEAGHILAPRINAMGRLTHALDVLRLLCTKDIDRARNLTLMLDTTNRERQIQMESNILHAKTIVAEKGHRRDKLIFIADERYHQGVIGLIAGKLVEEFYLPAIVISKGEQISKASARSIKGFNIVEFLYKASDLLEDVGGHPMAAGFTVKTENIEKLKEKLTAAIVVELDEEKLTQELKIDLEIDPADINEKFYQTIKKLSPFGIGNPQPTFLSRNVKVIGAQLVGKERQHLKLVIRDKSNIFHCIGFAMGKLYPQVSFDKPVDIVYTIEEDKWNGAGLSRRTSGLQLKLKDVKLYA